MSAAKATGSAWKFPPDRASPVSAKISGLSVTPLASVAERRRGVPQQVEHGAHDLGLAAQAVRVLHPLVADQMRHADGRAFHQATQRTRRLDLAGVTAQLVDARIERRIGAARRVGRERAGDQRRAEQRLRLEQSGERIGRRELRAVQQGEPFLGAEHQRRQTRFGQRPFGRHRRAVDVEGADADHRRRHVGERRQIARGADRPLGRHDRHQVLGQQRLEQGDDLATHARRALGEARKLERHHQPHDGHGHRRADTRGVRQHDVALQLLEVGRRDAHAGELSEAGVDAVDRLALGKDGRDRAGRGVDRGVAGRIERHRRATVDVAPGAQRYGARRKLDGTHGPMVAACPRPCAKEKLENTRPFV